MAERTDWNPILRAEFAKPYWPELQRFVADERAKRTVYPPPDEVFAAMPRATPLKSASLLFCESLRFASVRSAVSVTPTKPRNSASM